MRKVYIAGQMTGDPNYKQKFYETEEKLKQQNCLVINPAVLPDGFEQMEYYRINMAMIDVCDTVIFLPTWPESKGAHLEMGYALGTKKAVQILKAEDKNNAPA